MAKLSIFPLSAFLAVNLVLLACSNVPSEDDNDDPYGKSPKVEISTFSYAFATHSGSNSIASYPLGEDGGLGTPLIHSTMKTYENGTIGGIAPRRIAIQEKKALLFAVFFGDPSHSDKRSEIQSFRIDKSTGELTPLFTRSGIVEEDYNLHARNISLHPTKNVLYVSYLRRHINDPEGEWLRNGRLAAYSFVPETGEINLLNAMVVGKFPVRHRVDPSGKFLYVPHLSGKKLDEYGPENSIAIISLNETGALKSDNYVEHQTEEVPYAINFHPELQLAYVAYWSPASIRVYHQHPQTGALSEAFDYKNDLHGASPYRKPRDVIVDSKGSKLYLPIRGQSAAEADNHHRIMAFQIDAEGTGLSLEAQFPMSNQGPFSLTLNHQDNRLYSANIDGDSVKAFSINGDALQSINAYDGASQPWFIEFAEFTLTTQVFD